MTQRLFSCGLRPALSVALLLALGFASSAQAAPGDLDPSFGTGGKVTTDLNAEDDRAYALVIQADGKIVVAGWSYNGIDYDFALARYNTDGSLDTSFGTGGKVTTDFGSDDDATAQALTLQADGKIVVAGSTHKDGDSDFALARYNTDGSLDTTFGTDGKVTTYPDSARALAIQTDDKIVVAGFFFNFQNTTDFALARYNTDGSLDTTFGTDGTVTTEFTGSFSTDVANALALQADGKIVVVGFTYSTTDGFALARYNTDGSLDTSFGSDGTVTTDFGASTDAANALALQADGKIVVAGTTLARYNTDGSLDTSFGSGGTVFGGSGTAYALALEADGKIVVAGPVWSSTSTTIDFALARYNPDGSLDTTFGTDGTVTTDFGIGDDSAWALALQSDSKIVVAGYAYNGATNDFALVRYQGGAGVSSSSFLSFPLKGTSPGADESLDPYKAPIVSVLDHSMKDEEGNYGIYRCDEVVEAYTGEIGDVDPDVEGCKKHPGYTQEGDAPFYVNGHYVGSGGDTKYLNYDGHPGIDYQAGDGTEVYAAVSGTVHYPKNIVGIRRPNAAYKMFHALELVPDGFPDYKIYYLHLSTHPATGESVEKEDTTPGCPPIVDLPLPEGTHVDAGCLIALSGHAGPRGTPPHLHFEVQKAIPIDQVQEEAKEFLKCIDDEDKACVPVDPYGWDGDGSDPYELLTSVNNARLWAHLPVVNSVNPTSVSAGVFDLTITGEGFDSEAADCLIQQSDDYSNPVCLQGTILSRSSTQLVVQENLLFGTYFVHVENGDGRRSNWKKLVVSGSD